jgi:hypothetical protein
MTPEEIAAAAAVTTPVVEPVVETGTGDTTPVVMDPTEAAARTRGWKPKEEFVGDPSTWVSAEAFVAREPLFDKIRSQSRELREVKKTVDAMARHFTKSVEHAVTAKITELEYQKEQAIKSGDVAEVKAIDKAIKQQETARADVPTKSEVAPEVTAWVEANPWYIKDPELHDFAYVFNETYLRRNPTDLEGSLRETAAATKRAFPDKFPKAPVKPDATVPVVEGGGSPAGGGGKKYSMNRLTADQRRVYDQIVATHKITTHDNFFKDLEEIGELR